MAKSPGPKRAMSSSSLAGLKGGAESEREGDPSESGGERPMGPEMSARQAWFVAWCLVRPGWPEQIQLQRSQRTSGESRAGIWRGTRETSEE